MLLNSKATESNKDLLTSNLPEAWLLYVAHSERQPKLYWKAFMDIIHLGFGRKSQTQIYYDRTNTMTIPIVGGMGVLLDTGYYQKGRRSKLQNWTDLCEMLPGSSSRLQTKDIYCT